MATHLRIRRGTTVVEVLIALIILSIAALGSAATLAYSARQQFRARTLREAYDALRMQGVYIETQSCAALADGHSVRDGLTVRWTVERGEMSARVTMTADVAGVAPTLVTEVWCG